MTQFRYPRTDGNTLRQRDHRALTTWLDQFNVTHDGQNNVDLGSGVVTAGGFQPTYITPVAATVAPTSYPSGVSWMDVSGDSSWPVSSGLVETHILDAGVSGWRISQRFTPNIPGESYERNSADGSTWGSWNLTATLQRSYETTTGVSVSPINSWEVALGRTFGGFPTTRFDAAVSVEAKGWGSCNPSAALRLRAGVSLDGGTTYTYGLKNLGSVQPVTGHRYTPLNAHVLSSGAVTGSIIARMELWVSNTAAIIDDLQVKVLIGPSY